MRPPSHTDLDIIAAGKKLQSEGKKLTGYSLSQALGGGKQARLAEVWSNYVNNNSGESQEKPETQNPLDIDDDFFALEYLISSASIELTSTVESLFRKLAEDLRREAEKRVERLVDLGTRDLEEEKGALQAKLEMALREIERWKAHSEQWLKDMSERNREIDELTSQLTSVRNKLYELEKAQNEGQTN